MLEYTFWRLNLRIQSVYFSNKSLEIIHASFIAFCFDNNRHLGIINLYVYLTFTHAIGKVVNTL